MSEQIIQHPATKRLSDEAVNRFTSLRKQHDAAVNRMWAGTLAAHFTDDELVLLGSLLCPNDHALLRMISSRRRVRSTPKANASRF